VDEVSSLGLGAVLIKCDMSERLSKDVFEDARTDRTHFQTRDKTGKP
jgi:hypothetical protein